MTPEELAGILDKLLKTDHLKPAKSTINCVNNNRKTHFFISVGWN